MLSPVGLNPRRPCRLQLVGWSSRSRSTLAYLAPWVSTTRGPESTSARCVPRYKILPSTDHSEYLNGTVFRFDRPAFLFKCTWSRMHMFEFGNNLLAGVKDAVSLNFILMMPPFFCLGIWTSLALTSYYESSFFTDALFLIVPCKGENRSIFSCFFIDNGYAVYSK
jgi:hypothetical protein